MSSNIIHSLRVTFTYVVYRKTVNVYTLHKLCIPVAKNPDPFGCLLLFDFLHICSETLD